MPDVMKHVEYLSREIGPRPTGTEEEQQAALYITEKFQSEAGLTAHIEDFTSDSETDTARTICYLVTFVMMLLAIFLPIFAIPALIIAILAAVIVFLESRGTPILSRFFAHGISQNVVAKYEPAYAQGDGGARGRKIIVMARYDSGRVQSELNGGLFSILPILNKISFWGIIAAPILLLIRYVIFLHAEGIVAIIFTILMVLVLLALAIQLYFALSYRFAKYNDAANCNATGAATLIELAARVNEGYVGMSHSQYAHEAVVHGREAAYEAGVVPEGATLQYEVDETAPSAEAYDDGLNDAYDAAPSEAGRPQRGQRLRGFGRRAGRDAGHEPEPFAEAEGDASSSADEEGHGRVRNARARAAAGMAPMPLVEGTPDDPDAGLNAAKAAIAAMTGRPVSRGSVPTTTRTVVTAYEDHPTTPRAQVAAEERAAQAAAEERAAGIEAPNMWAGVQGAPVFERPAAVEPTNAAVGTPDRPDSEVDAAPFTPTASVAAPIFATPNAAPAASAASATASASSDAGVPDWYRRAQQKARRPIHPDREPAASRSRFNSALNATDEALAAEAAAAAAAAQAQAQAQMQAQVQAAQAGYAAPTSAQAAAATPGTPEAEEAAAASAKAQIPVAQAQPTGVSDSDVTAEFEMPFRQESPTGELNIAIEAPRSEPQPAQPARKAPATYEEYLAASGFSVEGSQPGAYQPEAAYQAAEPQQAADPGSTTAIPHVDVDLQALKSHTGPFQRIELPNLGNTGNLAPIAESQKQRAPLAAQVEDSQMAAKGLLSLLPAIDLATDAEESTEELHFFDDDRYDDEQAEILTATVSGMGTAGMTGAFAEVGADLIEAHDASGDDDELFVEDADDSAFEGSYTETGAFAGPGYMDMPKKRRGLFGKLFSRKQKDEEEISAHEWLDVDEDFDPREVGKARGGWESFRSDDDEDTSRNSMDGTNEAFDNDEWEDEWEDDRWNGGAFSGLRSKLGKRGQAAEPDVDDEPYDDGYDGYDGYAGAADYDDVPYNDEFDDGYDGPVTYDDDYDRSVEYDDIAPYDPDPDYRSEDELSPYASIASQASGMGSGFGANTETYAAEERELQQIFDFRSANIDTEVWFVALGSEIARQSGMKAFLREHGSELGNAVFVEIDALGAGTLSIVSVEGKYRTQATQSRVKRYVHKAAQLMGKRVPEVALEFQDSAASYANANGYQAMHLVGIQNGKPALLAQSDDVYESIDEQTLYGNINYLVELLKNI